MLLPPLLAFTCFFRGRLAAYHLSRKSDTVNGEQLIAARRSLAKRSKVLWVPHIVLLD